MIHLATRDGAWSEFVESCEDAWPYHHPAWSSVLAESYGYRPFALAVADEGGVIAAGLPMMEVRGLSGRRRWLSLPFTDLCHPLAFSNDAMAALAAELEPARRAAGVSQIEIRDKLEGPGVFQTVDAVTHTLELAPDPDAVLATFSRSQVVRNITRAEREGVDVRRGAAASDLTRVFYRLHLQTRRRQGVPVQPRRFFELLWEQMIEPGLGFVLLAYSDETPVAGAVFLTWKRTVTYKYGASDPRYLNLRPNNILFWRAIEWACRGGYQRFDFGRTDLDNEGLRRFKSGWGTLEEPLTYSVLADAPPKRSVKRAAPVMGSLIRHSPPWVCRAVGTALYRYAA
jgi:CelD/BcsL family acetyltransferase involved in cellulose biosynthesis